jgi:hypothetical protein
MKRIGPGWGYGVQCRPAASSCSPRSPAKIGQTRPIAVWGYCPAAAFSLNRIRAQWLRSAMSRSAYRVPATS